MDIFEPLQAHTQKVTHWGTQCPGMQDVCRAGRCFALLTTYVTECRSSTTAPAQIRILDICSLARVHLVIAIACSCMPNLYTCCMLLQQTYSKPCQPSFLLSCSRCWHRTKGLLVLCRPRMPQNKENAFSGCIYMCTDFCFSTSSLPSQTSTGTSMTHTKKLSP